MSNFCLIKKCQTLFQPVKDAVTCNLQLTCRTLYTVPNETLDKQRTSPLNKNREQKHEPTKNLKAHEVSEYRDKLPEFLPNPLYKDRICGILERQDMFKRRKVINIPEFYVGSILAVTTSDQYAPGKSSRFVGICIDRSEAGLLHRFVLRNVMDDQGIEIMYEMYSPLIMKIEVLKLEKRLDDKLYYLRDCPLQYSYIPQDMKGDFLHKGLKVPVNETKVKLGPRPWLQRWERMDLKGVEEFTDWKNDKVREKAMKKKEHPQAARPWEKVDIVKHYRESINPVEAADVYGEVENNSRTWRKK